MKQVEFKNVEFSYEEGLPVVNNLSFTVEKGTYTTLIGHNGSGKSTVAKLLIGLLEVNKGEIYIDDLLMSEENLKEIRSRVGMVFQNPDNQFIGSTVRDDIAFGLENARVAQEKMDEIINRFADNVGMIDYLDRKSVV